MSHKPILVDDECWVCGTLLDKGKVYIDVVLNIVGRRVRSNVYNRCCLNCAIEYRMIGINFDNLVECAPKDWLYQVTASNLARLKRDSE